MSEVIERQDSLPTIEAASQVFNLFQVLESVASNPSADADKMVKVMDMLERAQDREASQAYNRDMVDVQAEIPLVGTNKSTDTGRYANHEQIVAAAGPIWKKYFALSFGEEACPREAEGYFRTVCDCLHKDGHTKRYWIDLPKDDKSVTGKTIKTEVHATGSTFTYGQRYLTCKIFNIPTGDDKDGSSPVREALTITDEQVLEMDSFINENNVDRAKYMSWLKENGGYEELGEIYTKDFDQAMKVLRKARGNA